jgi:hypothetical protein
VRVHGAGWLLTAPGPAAPKAVARDAGIELAVGGVQREFEDVPLGNAVLDGAHFRRGLVGRADDEIAVGLDRRNLAVGQFGGRHVSGRVRIARGRPRTSRRSVPRGAVVWAIAARRGESASMPRSIISMIFMERENAGAALFSFQRHREKL